MWISFKNWLKRPFPLLTFPGEKWITSILIGLFVFLFLSIFQPFGIDITFTKDLIDMAIFGIISTVAMLFNFFVLPFLFPKFFDETKWDILHMIIFVFLIIFTVSFLNVLFSAFFFRDLHHESYLESSLRLIYQTFLIGIFPTFLVVYISERGLYSKHKKEAKKVSDQINQIDVKPAITETNFNLTSENEKEHFNISNKNLLYATSESNYVSLFFAGDDSVNEHILRNTLSNIEAQLKEFSYIVRCHKSFIVNTLHVKNITGNARGYTLHLKDTDIEIPVSRSFPKDELFRLVNN